MLKVKDILFLAQFSTKQRWLAPLIAVKISLIHNRGFKPGLHGPCSCMGWVNDTRWVNVTRYLLTTAVTGPFRIGLTQFSLLSNKERENWGQSIQHWSDSYQLQLSILSFHTSIHAMTLFSFLSQCVRTCQSIGLTSLSFLSVLHAEQARTLLSKGEDSSPLLNNENCGQSIGLTSAPL